MIQPTEIERILKGHFPGCAVLVEDLTGTMDHFQVTLVTDAFKNQSMIKQHQMVYAALREQMKEQIHALTLRTYDVEAWDQIKEKQTQLKGIS